TKQEILPVDSLQCDGFLQPSMASARILGIGQATSCLHELHDLPSRPFQTLAESNRLDRQNSCCFLAVNFQDFTQNIGKPMRTIQAQKHPQRAAHTDLLKQNRIVRIRGIVSQAFFQVPPECFECKTALFHAALSESEQMIRGDSIDPRRETALAAEG